jgi:altronate dehydratase
MIKILKINQKDNVAIILNSIKKGESFDLEGNPWTAKENINFGHKIALIDLPRGSRVVKYGEEIGCATQDIKKGDWVHVHNLESDRGRLKGEEYHANEI